MSRITQGRPGKVISDLGADLGGHSSKGCVGIGIHMKALERVALLYPPVQILFPFLTLRVIRVPVHTGAVGGVV